MQVWSCLSAGVDQHVTSLSLYARYQLAELLDQKDWIALGKALNLNTPDINEEEPKPKSLYSPTDGLMADWVQTAGQYYNPPFTSTTTVRQVRRRIRTPPP